MLEAVQTIHEERIVHGDLKPANFLFVRAGVLFGGLDFEAFRTASGPCGSEPRRWRGRDGGLHETTPPRRHRRDYRLAKIRARPHGQNTQVQGRLKLIDFGIARAIKNDTTNIYRDTQIGTLNYMSPEAIRDSRRRAAATLREKAADDESR